MYFVYVPFLTRNRHQEYDPKVKTLHYESPYKCRIQCYTAHIIL